MDDTVWADDVWAEGVWEDGVWAERSDAPPAAAVDSRKLRGRRWISSHVLIPFLLGGLLGNI